jgi:hypothetical protein
MAKMTPAMDAKMDKAVSVKPGSKKDDALDKKRGVPTGKAPPFKKGGKK